MEPAVPEESLDQSEEQEETTQPKASYEEITELQHHTSSLPPKKARPGFLPLARSEQEEDPRPVANPLYRSNSSRQFYRPKKGVPNERDDSVFYIRRGPPGSAPCSSHQLLVVSTGRPPPLTAAVIIRPDWA